MRSSVPLAAALAAALLASGCGRLPWKRSVPFLPGQEPVVEYRVKRGDTLERVAAWHGVEASSVRSLNGIDRGDALEPGSVLRIPKRPLATYALRSGDTLGQVGQWYGVDVEALIHLNDVADVRRLEVGRVIRIPATATRDGRRAALARSRAKRAAPAVAATPPVSAGAPEAGAEPSPSPPPAAGAEIDRRLAQADQAYDAADFDGALAAARSAEQQLAGAPLSVDDRRRLARAHLIAGMSEVALGREEAARCSFRAATAADAAIALDPARTSPKIVTVFDEAQAAAR